MRAMGNNRGKKLYGSVEAMKNLPAPDASHEKWLEFFRNKYERRRWAPLKKDGAGSVQQTKQAPEVATEDLLGFHATEERQTGDFFAEFDL